MLVTDALHLGRSVAEVGVGPADIPWSRAAPAVNIGSIVERVTTVKRKATKEKSFSEALGKAIAFMCLKYRDLTFEDIVESYRVIERTALARVSDNQFLALETKRRVAEQLVDAAIYKDRPWEESRVLLDHLFRLGFTNIEVKVNVLLIYSKYCLKIGRNSEGIALLEPLESELETELSRKDIRTPAKRFYSVQLQSTRALLEKLRAASNT